MKWHAAPHLNLERLAASRALIVGAGTLGCNIARLLLGWGVQHITFVDYGSVSISNPIRQSLYQFRDGVKHRKKAETAASRLKQINPLIHSEGYDCSILMPDHWVHSLNWIISNNS